MSEYSYIKMSCYPLTLSAFFSRLRISSTAAVYTTTSLRPPSSCDILEKPRNSSLLTRTLYVATVALCPFHSTKKRVTFVPFPSLCAALVEANDTNAVSALRNTAHHRGTFGSNTCIHIFLLCKRRSSPTWRGGVFARMSHSPLFPTPQPPSDRPRARNSITRTLSIIVHHPPNVPFVRSN